MTDPSVRVPSPPFSEDLLADLHAGVLDSETSAALWPVVHADPDAHAFVTALDGVTASLATLNSSKATHERIPNSLAERINSALDLQSEQLEPPAEAAVVPFRRRPQAWVLGAAAAVLAAFVIVVIGTRDSEPAESVVAQPSTPATSAVDDPDSAFLLSLVGSKNLGPLDDPSKLAGCLRANGIDEGRPLLGSGEIRIDGGAGDSPTLHGIAAASDHCTDCRHQLQRRESEYVVGQEHRLTSTVSAAMPPGVRVRGFFRVAHLYRPRPLSDSKTSLPRPPEPARPWHRAVPIQDLRRSEGTVAYSVH